MASGTLNWESYCYLQSCFLFHSARHFELDFHCSLQNIFSCSPCWGVEETHVMGMTLWRNSWGVHGSICDGESVPSDAMSGGMRQATHARATCTCTSASSSHPVPMQRHIPVLMQVVGMWRMPHAPAPGLGLFSLLGLSYPALQSTLEL